MSKCYYAWVPNVIGRLSFSFTGLSSHPERVVFRTTLRDYGRHFAGFQRRDLSDTTIPIVGRFRYLKYLADKYLFAKSGCFYFLCLMKSREDGQAIQGRVFIFERDAWLKIRDEVKGKINTLFSGEIGDIPLHKHFEDIIDGLSVGKATFHLDRDGALKIGLAELPEKIFEDGPIPFDYNHAVAAQIFFFIRDMFHSHKFHVPSTDTILDVYEDEAKWKFEVNYALARKAIALRRQDSVKSLRRSLGILTYLKAFQENMMSEEQRKEAGFSIEFLQDSASYGIPLAEQREQDSIRHQLQDWSEFGLKVLAFVFTYATLVKSGTIPLPESMTTLSLTFDFIQNNILWALLILGIFMIASITATRVRLEERDRFLANVARLSLAYDNKRYATVMFLLGVLLTLGALSIFSYIFYQLLSIPQ